MIKQRFFSGEDAALLLKEWSKSIAERTLILKLSPFGRARRCKWLNPKIHSELDLL
jgi:hypothetical protein